MKITEIKNNLKLANFIKVEEHWELTIPIILSTTNSWLKIRAFIDNNKLFFTCDGSLFFEIDESPKLIITDFNEHLTKNTKYQNTINLNQNYLIKEVNLSALFIELDDFIRYILELDKFMNN